MTEVIKLSSPVIDIMIRCQDSNLLLILSAQETNQQCLGALIKRGTPKYVIESPPFSYLK